MKKTCIAFANMNRKKIFILVVGLSLLSPAYSSSYFDVETAIISDVSSLEKIKGKIMDKEGTPIPCALIAEQIDIYSNNMVESDSTGYFEIDVKTGSSLIVSAVGYLPLELKPSEYQRSKQLNITLEMNPDVKMEDVIVTAKRKTIVTTPTGFIYNMNENPLK